MLRAAGIVVEKVRGPGVALFCSWPLELGLCCAGRRTSRSREQRPEVDPGGSSSWAVLDAATLTARA